jgi:hypothetical protein
VSDEYTLYSILAYHEEGGGGGGYYEGYEKRGADMVIGLI